MNYNKKLSGAKAVLVPIVKLGKNSLPYIEDLKNRFIKYIDFYPCAYLPETDAQGLTTTEDMYLSLTDRTGNMYYIKEMPLARFNFAQTNGCRQAIYNSISLQNSYILCCNSAAVGTTALLVFWYDLPEYSRANKAELTITDSLTVPLTTAVRHNIMPDEERMADKRFRRILLGFPTTPPDYNTGITNEQAQNLYITLRKGTYNVVENLPLYLLYQIAMLEKTEFANIIFDLQNSFITIGGAHTIPDVDTDYIGKSVFLNMVYEK